MRRVILPQALRLILPPMTGLAVSLVQALRHRHGESPSSISTNEARNVIPRRPPSWTFEIHG